MKKSVFLIVASIVVFVLVSCTVVVQEVQTEVYVSANGNDVNQGTKSSPVRSLDKAIEIATSKGLSKIYMESATWIYSSPATISIPKNIEIAGGYDSSFSSQVGYSVLENASLNISGATNVTISRLGVSKVSGRGIKIENSSNINLLECIVFKITNISSTQFEGVGIVIRNSIDVKVDRGTVYNCYGQSSSSRVYGAGIAIINSQNVDIWRNAITNCSVDSVGGGGGAIAVNAGNDIDIWQNSFSVCGGDNAADNDSVIIFYGTSPNNLVVEENTIGGKYPSYTYGLYEDGIDVVGHKVISNRFLSNTLIYPYYDGSNGSFTNIDQLNNGDAGTSEATGNTWE